MVIKLFPWRAPQAKFWDVALPSMDFLAQGLFRRPQKREETAVAHNSILGGSPAKTPPENHQVFCLILTDPPEASHTFGRILTGYGRQQRRVLVLVNWSEQSRMQMDVSLFPEELNPLPTHS